MNSIFSYKNLNFLVISSSILKHNELDMLWTLMNIFTCIIYNEYTTVADRPWVESVNDWANVDTCVTCDVNIC